MVILYGVFKDGKKLGQPYIDTSKEVCLIWARFLKDFSFNKDKQITVRQLD